MGFLLSSFFSHPSLSHQLGALWFSKGDLTEFAKRATTAKKKEKKEVILSLDNGKSRTTETKYRIIQ